MKVGVGGTFNVLHRGHRALLDKAVEVGDFVAVGVTSDHFARSLKQSVLPEGERAERVRRYLEGKGRPFSITLIDTPAGGTSSPTDIEALVVSPETLPSARRINEQRAGKGLQPLQIIIVPHVLAEDSTPISSTRIMSGEMDEEGHLLRPLRAVVGSENGIKIDAVRNVMSRLFSQVEVRGIAVRTSVGEQPKGEETVRGAVERAKAALGDADFGIGLEAGVFDTEFGMYDVQYCAIVDKRGHVTIGHGSGFRYPPAVAEKVREGWSVGRSFRELYGWEREGKKEGAISFLTRGALKRTELGEQAVMAAMVPRIRPELYPDL